MVEGENCPLKFHLKDGSLTCMCLGTWKQAQRATEKHTHAHTWTHAYATVNTNNVIKLLKCNKFFIVLFNLNFFALIIVCVNNLVDIYRIIKHACKNQIILILLHLCISLGFILNSSERLSLIWKTHTMKIYIYIVIVSTLLEYDISLQSLLKTRLMAMSYNLYFISKHVFYFIVRNIIRQSHLIANLSLFYCWNIKIYIYNWIRHCSDINKVDWLKLYNIVHYIIYCITYINYIFWE